MFRMNSLLGPENHSASRVSISDAPAQPAISGANTSSASSRPRLMLLPRTIKGFPPQWYKRLSHHHFAARPWPDSSALTETADYHQLPDLAIPAAATGPARRPAN